VTQIQTIHERLDSWISDRIVWLPKLIEFQTAVSTSPTISVIMRSVFASPAFSGTTIASLRLIEVILFSIPDFGRRVLQDRIDFQFVSHYQPSDLTTVVIFLEGLAGKYVCLRCMCSF